ncbi:MAG: ABC transporter permease subunit [Bacillota bacterium]|nr:ABC transporter permease subunit [Bacillota bacterium]
MIHNGLIIKELRENKWKYGIILIYLCLFGTSLYLAYEFLDSFLYQVTGIDKELLSRLMGNMLEDFYLFAWANWYGKNLYQAISVFAIVLGMGKIAGEAGRGTISFLFTKPLSRKTIFFSKYFSGAFGLALVIIAPTLIAYLASQIYGEALPLNFLTGIPLAYTGGLIIYSFTVLYSAIFDDQVKAAVAAIITAMVLSIPSWFADLRFLSLYAKMQGWPVYFQQSGWQISLVIMLIISGIICFMGLRIVENKDF